MYVGTGGLERTDDRCIRGQPDGTSVSCSVASLVRDCGVPPHLRREGVGMQYPPERGPEVVANDTKGCGREQQTGQDGPNPLLHRVRQ